jgi:hypothetical protein
MRVRGGGRHHPISVRTTAAGQGSGRRRKDVSGSGYHTTIKLVALDQDERNGFRTRAKHPHHAQHVGYVATGTGWRMTQGERGSGGR